MLFHLTAYTLKVHIFHGVQWTILSEHFTEKVSQSIRVAFGNSFSQYNAYRLGTQYGSHLAGASLDYSVWRGHKIGSCRIYNCCNLVCFMAGMTTSEYDIRKVIVIRPSRITLRMPVDALESMFAPGLETTAK